MVLGLPFHDVDTSVDIILYVKPGFDRQVEDGSLNRTADLFLYVERRLESLPAGRRILLISKFFSMKLYTMKLSKLLPDNIRTCFVSFFGIILWLTV